MLDSHCHLDDPRFAHDLDAVLDAARRAGVSSFVCAGYSPERWPRQEAIARAHPDVVLACGIHPWRAAEARDSEVVGLLDRLDAQVSLAREHGVPLVALGEMGLDHMKRFGKQTRPRQVRVFRHQLALARALECPVIVHVVRAHGAALDILKRDGVPRCGGVMHSYSGSAELVRAYVGLGLHISFSGAFMSERALKLRAALTATPDERLLFETDAPDQSLEKGTRNEPSALSRIIEAAAQLRGVETQALVAATTERAEALFRIGKSRLHSPPR